MKVIKSISFRYAASSELTALFEDFRLMCNDAIRIAVKEKPRSRFNLIELAYPRLKEYGLHTHYILTACEVAYAAFKNKNRKSDPYVRRAFMKIDNQSYALTHVLLRIPYKPRQFVFLTLQGSDFHTDFIDDPDLRKGEITITPQFVNISLSKEKSEFEPLGHMGIDVNERNVTAFDTGGSSKAYDTSEVAEIKARYREARARIGKRTRQDQKVSQKLYAKYGRRERNRTVKRIHLVSKAIVSEAKEQKFGIVLEKLKGIRKMYHKGNCQGNSFRERMNSWPFYEFQRQVRYKAAWLGVPVLYVNPRGTSQNCPECGSRVVNLQERKLFCQQCDRIWDSDVLASMNIMACAVPQARPLKHEAVKGNEATTALILRAEVRKLARQD